MVKVVCTECGARQFVSVLREPDCERCAAGGESLEAVEREE